jgi:hypothetical protein
MGNTEGRPIRGVVVFCSRDTGGRGSLGEKKEDEEMKDGEKIVRKCKRKMRITRKEIRQKGGKRRL